MKASVFLITYNHEPFIAQAVAGALAQEAPFDYEIVIGEDASSDGTGRIVRELERAHPGKIRATVRDANVGLQRNFIETYQACRGEYVAFLDGDDYWTSPHKLRKQVELLERDLDLSLCFHDAGTIHQDEGQVRCGPPVGPGPGRTRFRLEDVLLERFMASCSLVARNRLIDSFPTWASTVRCMDWLFTILNAQYGDIGYINEEMAVYRQHRGGSWSVLPYEQRRDEMLQFYTHLLSTLSPEMQPLLRVALDRIQLWDGNLFFQSQVRNFQAERDSLQSQIQNYQTEIGNLLEGYEHTRLWAIQLETENRFLQSEVECLQGRLQSCEQTRRWAIQLETENHSLRSEVERLRALLAHYQPQSARLHALYRGLERSMGMPAIRTLRRLRALSSRLRTGLLGRQDPAPPLEPTSPDLTRVS
jgi:glycosyltransferase involved in cell wall biosynthesis